MHDQQRAVLLLWAPYPRRRSLLERARVMFGGRRCTRCDRLRAACICESVGRRHRNHDRRERKPQQFVANPANRTHKWCSYGALVRNGRCVSATCGNLPKNR
jgi:hypothetical protein